MPTPISLTLAHSPDPDDVFMWWPITGMIDPPRDAQAVEHAKVISKPEIDTGGIQFRSIAADIAVLNRRAVSAGDLDITALSMFAWAHVHERYQLTSFGGSFGEGYGPRVVARAGLMDPGPKRDLASELREREAVVAVPGVRTTAFLMLCMCAGVTAESARFKVVEMPFDHILEAVANGRVTHGLLIHQSQLTFADLGLELVMDLGKWWGERTGLPLPLGGNAVRRGLDEQHGAGTTQRVVNTLAASIAYALEHRERSIEYCMRFAPELTRERAEKYIQMYVSGLTIDAGERGRVAVQRVLDEGAAMGMCPPTGRVEFLEPSRKG